MGPFAIAVLIVAGVAAMTLASHAVRAVSRIWLRHWVERRLRGAGLAEAYLEQPQRLQLAAGAGAAAVVMAGGAMMSLSLRTEPTTLGVWLAREYEIAREDARRRGMRGGRPPPSAAAWT